MAGWPLMQPRDRELELAIAQMADGYGEILARLSQELRRDERVGGLFVIGSTARGEADVFSDLDLVVVSHDGQAAKFAEDLPEVLKRAMPVVMSRWTLPGTLMSVVTSAWLRVDVFVVDATAVHKRRVEPAVCVFDDIGVNGFPIRTPVRAGDELRDQAERFLRSIGLLVRDLRRGDLRLLCFSVEFLVDELVTLMFHEIDRVRGPQKGTYHQLPRESLQVIDGLPVARPEPQSVIDAHLAVAAAYLPRARALSSRWAVPWPTEMEDATRRYLRHELGVELP
ncbi:MAG: nucleotidyltransferase domain-containing protein [Chloroflexota bacterium]|nr:nucleotidyltransferase domain-containing protein [Chloroflexota bacterium]